MGSCMPKCASIEGMPLRPRTTRAAPSMGAAEDGDKTGRDQHGHSDARVRVGFSAVQQGMQQGQHAKEAGAS